MEVKARVQQEMRQQLKDWDRTLAVFRSTVDTDVRPERFRTALSILQNLRTQTECDLTTLSQVSGNEWSKTKTHLEDLLEFMALEYSNALED